MNGMEDDSTLPRFIGSYEAESFEDACKMAVDEGKIKIKSLDHPTDDFTIRLYMISKEIDSVKIIRSDI